MGPAALLIGGMLAQMLGTQMQSKDAGKYEADVYKAQADAAERNRVAQRGYADQAARQQSATVDKVRPTAQRQADATASRTAELQGAVRDGEGYVDPSGTTPQIVADAYASRLNAGADDARRDAGNLARLRATDDMLFDNSLALAGNASELGNIGQMSAGQSGLLPTQLTAARMGVRRPNNLGALLAGGGQLATMAGFSGRPG